MPKNTYIDFKLENGETVKMTLAFYALYQLKPKNKAMYDKYNAVMTKGVNEEIDMIIILYTAYLCANIDDIDNCMKFEEFMQQCGSDRYAVKSTMEKLVKPKKQ